MAYNIVQVKADMSAALHGSTVNQITNIYGLFNRAARVLLADCDPNETMRTAPPAPVYPGVYSYVAPTDLKGNRLFDIKPQVNRQDFIDVLQTDEKTFDRAKADIAQGVLVTTVFNSGVKTLNLAVPKLLSIVLNAANGVTTNGTWAGTVTGVTNNNLYYVDPSGSSVQFTATTGQYVENSTMAPVDLTTVKPSGEEFAWVWFDGVPTSASVNMHIGTSATDYWSASASSNYDGTAFHYGWNLLGFPWATLSASQSGSPNIAAVNYLRFTFTNPPAGVTRINNITGSLGSVFEVAYYSKYLFRDATTGAFKEVVTSDSDIVNLDTDSYQLFLDQVMILASQQKQGVDGLQSDLPFFQKSYDDGVKKYQAKYPSQALKTTAAYYPFKKRNYSGFMSRRV